MERADSSRRRRRAHDPELPVRYRRPRGRLAPDLREQGGRARRRTALQGRCREGDRARQGLGQDADDGVPHPRAPGSLSGPRSDPRGVSAGEGGDDRGGARRARGQGAGHVHVPEGLVHRSDRRRADDAGGARGRHDPDRRPGAHGDRGAPRRRERERGGAGVVRGKDVDRGRPRLPRRAPRPRRVRVARLARQPHRGEGEGLR